MSYQFDGVYFLDSVSGQRYYYSPSGSDSNAGTGPTVPWVSLSKTPTPPTYHNTYYLFGF